MGSGDYVPVKQAGGLLDSAGSSPRLSIAAWRPAATWRTSWLPAAALAGALLTLAVLSMSGGIGYRLAGERRHWSASDQPAVVAFPLERTRRRRPAAQGRRTSPPLFPGVRGSRLLQHSCVAVTELCGFRPVQSLEAARAGPPTRTT